MCNVYVQNVPKVEGFQFDGENGEEIIEFVGGEDYGKVVGDTLELSLQGKDPRSQKVTVNRGQFVVKTNTGTKVVNEGEFTSNFTNLDGSLIEAITPEPPADPVPDEELVYQPGFSKPERRGAREEKPSRSGSRRKAVVELAQITRSSEVCECPGSGERAAGERGKVAPGKRSLRQAYGINFYRPHAKQDKFHRAGDKVGRYVRTGNRGGKTKCGAAEDVAWLLGGQNMVPPFL